MNLNEYINLLGLLKILLLSFGSLYTFLKITKNENVSNMKEHLAINGIAIILLSIIVEIVSNISDEFLSVVLLMIGLNIIFSRIYNNKLNTTLIATIISLSINYIIYFISVILNFIINIFTKINNDYINIFLIIIVHVIFLKLIFTKKRFKRGFSFLEKKINDEYIEIFILNISSVIILLSILLMNVNIDLNRKVFVGFIIISIIMFITIQKSLQLYYKQKLLIQDLNETKEELKKKNEEIKELEQENLNFSKTSHSIAHKQKALEYKLNEILLKSEIAEEIDIRDKVEKLRKEITKNKAQIELTKTNIEEIDDMLKYMQSECTKNDIEFDLKIQGNIYHMVNNIIEKEDLEILLADHIKNAIIAIQNSDNTNKTILVKLGIINGVYSLHIYDSGIEFEVETLKNLGKKPSTTHADQGGTGMGFMNTFDTLKKYKASLIINEYGKPSKENYTKSISIEFDKKNEYKVISYRKQCEILSYLGSK